MRRTPTGMSLVLTLVVASCGGGKTGVATPPTTTPMLATTTIAADTTTTTAVTAAVVAGDQAAKAKAATLQPSDFSGFDPVPEAAGGGLNIEHLWTELMACLGVPKGTPTGVSTSPTFKQGLATQARATVEYTDDASAAAIAAGINGPNFAKCSETAFAADVKRSAPEGGVPGPVAVAASQAPPVAPKSSTFRITVTVSLAELKVPLFQDFFVIYTGGAVIRALFLNPGSEFPQDLERSLLTKVINRT